MELHCLEGRVCQALVDEAHCLDPVGKDQHLGQVALPCKRLLHCTGSERSDMDVIKHQADREHKKKTGHRQERSLKVSVKAGASKDDTARLIVVRLILK